ncbi:phage pre-tape measure protein [Pseudomonas asplenii]|uniref:phage pre-tape measure protein n=1 Tax=Pseudomonas asplenii TaxID=53407 RepID=UPI0003788066|nr:hypothetical protein [Pseudomonas fuscovaginae]
MALSDLVIPSRKITLHQSSEDMPEVTIDVFGLTTSDFVYLVDGYRTQLAAIFLRNAKESLSNPETSSEILQSFPDFAAACIACGSKQREAEEYVRNLPFPVGLELLSAVFELTFPQGLKKSLAKIAPTILALLKK